jgi:hypothetical protein
MGNVSTACQGGQVVSKEEKKAAGLEQHKNYSERKT